MRAVIDVPVPRPRDRATLARHPAYDAIQEQLLRILAEDGLAAA